MAFNLEHTYFTHVTDALSRILYVHLGLMLVVFASFANCMLSSQIDKNTDNSSVWPELATRIAKWRTWHFLLPLTFTFFIFFSSVPQSEYLVNTFPFVFEFA